MRRFRPFSITVCIAFTAVLISLAGAATATENDSSFTLYVATNGNDTWSGTLAKPNKGKTDGPFASLNQARDALRKRKTSGAPAGPVKVLMRGGGLLHAESVSTWS